MNFQVFKCLRRWTVSTEDCVHLLITMQLLCIMVTGEHGDCGGHVIKLHRGPHTPVLIYIPVKCKGPDSSNVIAVSVSSCDCTLVVRH